MKILLISNEYTRPGRICNPIIGRIIRSLESNLEVESVNFCPFKNQFRNFYEIRKAAKKVDIIHIQFGGLYSFLIWFCLIGINKPKVLTFHGTDIHAKEIKSTSSNLVKLKIWLSQKASFCSIFMFDKLGFVSDTLYPYIPKWIYNRMSEKFFMEPLGVDYDLFVPEDNESACKKLGIPIDKYVLFSDLSNTKLKRRDIASAIIDELGDGYKLLVMCKVKPELVPTYINATDFIILTSDEEGSPNITREALSLNKMVFSVDVGDVKQQLQGLTNSCIISRNPKEAAYTIRECLAKPYVDNTRETLRNRIDFTSIANDVIRVYKDLLK
jgi:teichuronic acid biosynthesis glycosyltransferase TuaC